MTGVTAWRGTVTKDNHLYGLFRTNPQMASDVMTVLISSMYLPTLDTYLSKEVPVREYDDDSELFWDIMTSSRKNIPLVEARYADGTPVTSASNPNVGVGFEPFYIVTATDWFAIGEIVWGNYNETYPMIVKEEGYTEGTNTVYLVEPFGANMSNGIPAERLLPGERLSPGYNPIEDNFSRRVGDVRFSSPIGMKEDWQRVRLHHKIGGKELGKRLACHIPITKEVNGVQKHATVDRWIHNVTWTIEKAWVDCKNNSLERGVSTRMENGEYSNIGLSGNANRQGAGFREQMARGQQFYYTVFSIGLVEDALMGVSAGRLDYKKRKFVMRTGERGALQFSKEAKKEMSGWIPLYSMQSPSYVTKGPEKNFTNGNAVTIADYQVTRWLSSNGLEVELMIDSSKDDLMTNKIMHPKGGPAESYRYDIFYAADEEQPNVQKCKLKGQSEYRGYQWGPFYNPFTGQANNENASYDEDAAEVHYKATQGVLIYDPLRCISLIPAMLQA